MYSTYGLAMAYYAFAFYLASTNTIKYIIGEKRYKDHGNFLVMFYIFTFCIIITRVVQLSWQLFQDHKQANYTIVTYYLASFTGASLNSVILVVAFMIMELRNLLSLPNLGGQVAKSNFKVYLAMAVIGAADAGIFVFWFLPNYYSDPATSYPLFSK